LNPNAVVTSLYAGAKIVWPPTLSSQQDVENGIPVKLGSPCERGICLRDDEGPSSVEGMALLWRNCSRQACH
jgi:hypothetical protein